MWQKANDVIVISASVDAMVDQVPLGLQPHYRIITIMIEHLMQYLIYEWKLSILQLSLWPDAGRWDAGLYASVTPTDCSWYRSFFFCKSIINMYVIKPANESRFLSGRIRHYVYIQILIDNWRTCD